MTVPLLDLRAQYKSIAAEIESAVLSVMRSGQYVMGPAVREFEEQAAAYIGSRHAIGCASGTDALLLALMALDVGPGSAVITTPYSFFSTVSSITRLGGLPLFADIDPDTYNIDPAAVEAVLAGCHADSDGRAVHRASKRRVVALMPVHLFGQAADMPALEKIADRYRLAIVEDAAQAIGTRDPLGRMAGAIGAMGCFSFFPSKNLGGLGDGGLITTEDGKLADRLKSLRVHGAARKYRHDEVGINSRLDSIQAAALSVKLRRLDAWHAARIANAERYRGLLSGPGLVGKVSLPRPPKSGRHIYNQFVVRAEKRDDLRAFLQSKGVGCEVYYPIPLHMQRCFAFLGMGPGALPEAELAAEQTLALPIYPELTDDQAREVADALVEFYTGAA